MKTKMILFPRFGGASDAAWVALALLALATLNPQFSTVLGQGTTTFTYQGQLRDGGTNANGTYIMTFKLYDEASGDNQIGSDITINPTLANGLFTVNLDFGAGAFNGGTRWLDITVQSGGDTQTLVPRVQVLPTPYALFANSANTASNLVGTLPASQLTGVLPSAQLSGNYTNTVTFSNSTNNFAGTFTGNGSGLMNLNASQLSSGTVSLDRLGALLNGNPIFTGFPQFWSTPVCDAGLGLQNTIIGSCLWKFDVGTFSTPGGAVDDCLIIYGCGVPYMVLGNGAATGGSFVASLANSMHLGGSLNVSGHVDVRDDDGNDVIQLYPDGRIFCSDVVASGDIQSEGDISAAGNIHADGSITTDEGFSTGADIDCGGVYTGYILCDQIDATGNIHADGDITAAGGMAASGNVESYGGVMYANDFIYNSDRNLKEEFVPVDSRDALERVASLPITRWNFKKDASTRHIGPMAQDFCAAFSVGLDSEHISALDEGGVALAAIQGLNQKLEETRAENVALKLRLEKLERLLNQQNGGGH